MKGQCRDSHGNPDMIYPPPPTHVTCSQPWKHAWRHLNLLSNSFIHSYSYYNMPPALIGKQQLLIEWGGVGRGGASCRRPHPYAAALLRPTFHGVDVVPCMRSFPQPPPPPPSPSPNSRTLYAPQLVRRRFGGWLQDSPRLPGLTVLKKKKKKKKTNILNEPAKLMCIYLDTQFYPWI